MGTIAVAAVIFALTFAAGRSLVKNKSKACSNCAKCDSCAKANCNRKDKDLENISNCKNGECNGSGSSAKKNCGKNCDKEDEDVSSFLL